MYQIEWGGIQHNEKTKRGDDVMRLSRNENVRIVYRRNAIQCKYVIEQKTINGDWAGFNTAKYSSDFIGEVEKAEKYILDEPI